VQHAQALLPPLCPMAKGKKVMFVFILEILDGTCHILSLTNDVNQALCHHMFVDSRGLFLSFLAASFNHYQFHPHHLISTAATVIFTSSIS